jgi:hypothetical protein
MAAAASAIALHSVQRPASSVQRPASGSHPPMPVAPASLEREQPQRMAALTLSAPSRPLAALGAHGAVFMIGQRAIGNLRAACRDPGLLARRAIEPKEPTTFETGSPLAVFFSSPSLRREHARARLSPLLLFVSFVVPLVFYGSLFLFHRRPRAFPPAELHHPCICPLLRRPHPLLRYPPLELL